MEVKFGAGLPRQPSQTQKKSAAGAAGSFAENLRAAAGKLPATPEEAFERAFSDREHPDLRQLDEYFEGLIEKEMKGGGA